MSRRSKRRPDHPSRNTPRNGRSYGPEPSVPVLSGRPPGEGTNMVFPGWLRTSHAFNFLFMTLLVRSGIEIIGAHPKFY